MDKIDREIILKALKSRNRIRSINFPKFETLLETYNLSVEPFDYDNLLVKIKKDLLDDSSPKFNETAFSIIKRYAMAFTAATIAVVALFGWFYHQQVRLPDYKISQNVVTAQVDEVVTKTVLMRNIEKKKKFPLRDEIEKWALSKNAALVAYINHHNSPHVIVTIDKKGTVDAISMNGNSWSYNLESPVTAPLAWSNEAIFCATADYKITSISLYTGKPIWSKNIDGRILFGGGMVYHDGEIYAGTANGYFYSLQAHSGDILWSKKFNSGIFVPPLIVEGNIVVATNDGNLIQMKARTGIITSSLHIGKISGISRAHRRLYISTEEGNFICYDYEIMQEKWRYPTGVRLSHSPLVEHHRVFAFSAKGNVYCLNHEGQLMWTVDLGGTINFRPAFRDGGVYILAGKALYVLDSNDGSVRWSYVMDSFATTSATIAESTLVYGIENKGLVVLPLN